MPSLRSALFAGVAAMALAGTVAPAHRAEARDAPAATHVMRVALPDGSVAQIRYAGDVPPQIVLAPPPVLDAAMTDMAWPPGLTLAAGPFEALLHMQAAMDAQAAALLRAAAPVAPGYGAPNPLALNPGLMPVGALPPGTRGESVVMTVTGQGVCTRTTRFGVPASGGPARAVTQVSGDCAAVAPPRGALPATRPETPPAPAQPRTYRVRDTLPAGDARLVPVADWQR